jgi:hypothetical protein
VVFLFFRSPSLPDPLLTCIGDTSAWIASTRCDEMLKVVANRGQVFKLQRQFTGGTFQSQRLPLSPVLIVTTRRRTSRSFGCDSAAILLDPLRNQQCRRQLVLPLPSVLYSRRRPPLLDHFRDDSAFHISTLLREEWRLPYSSSRRCSLRKVDKPDLDGRLGLQDSRRVGRRRVCC